MPSEPIKIRLRYEKGLAPGDYVVTTALLRDIKATYGDAYQVGFHTTMPAIYAFNPNHTTFRPGDPSVKDVVLEYKQGMLSSSAGNKHHFLTWLYKDFQQKTGIHVPCLLPRPDLYLSPAQRQLPPISGRYWVVFGGGKSDFTVKHWSYARYQATCTRLLQEGIHLVQSGSAAPGHTHPRIQGALDLIGWGYLRELLWQVYHADGVIAPITLGMHVAAAFEKPCVVIAGGREEPWWEAYDNNWGQFGSDAEPVRVPHRYLHTLGQLECCKYSGCWTNKLQPTKHDTNICKDIVSSGPGSQQLPRCMSNITTHDVVSAVLSYYHDGTLTHPDQSGQPPRLLVDNVPWQPTTPPASVQSQVVSLSRGKLLDHPRLGGKLTICVGLHGNYLRFHQRLLDSLLSSTPGSRMDLRIALSGDSEETREYLASLKAAFTLYELPDASGKYAVMRRMFHDPDRPITTPYVAWFDGFCQVRQSDWLNIVAETILKQQLPVGAYSATDRFYPEKLPYVGCSPVDVHRWLASRSWHRGVPADQRGGIYYPQGWFFVVSAEAIRKCDLPDETARQTGGDVVMGEQLRQNGYRIVPINLAGSLVRREPQNTRPSSAQSSYPWQL